MSLKIFYVYSNVICFGDRATRQTQQAGAGEDKLAAIREVWDKMSKRMPVMYDPSPEVMVDEHDSFQRYSMIIIIIIIILNSHGPGEWLHFSTVSLSPPLGTPINTPVILT